MSQENNYQALAYYSFVALEDPLAEVKKHKNFFKERDVSGRIYLSEEGINGQMSGKKEDTLAYQDWLKEDPRFRDITFKIHEIPENCFPRMTVKYRKQLVALDTKVDPSEGGEYVSPQQWRAMIESKEDYLLLDVRNTYEWKIGHFEGAVLPPLDQFRAFPDYAKELKQAYGPSKKIMMCCTGGIRCELYSALLKKEGFSDVYQLEGGIIHYGQTEGSAHWKGKLFVFDDRMAISIDGKESEPIAHCSFCDCPNDVFYNCSNMDCNALFLACDACIEKQRGCCSPSCQEAKRVRPYKPGSGNKPFRRKHFLEGNV